MKIREVTPADVPEVLRMAMDFFAKTGISELGPFSPSRFLQTLDNIIENKSGKVFVAEEDGRLIGQIGVVLSYVFFADVLQANELFWWVDPDYRKGPTAIKLLREAEAYARASGVNIMSMGCLESSDASVGNIYLKLGYTPHEHSFIKVL